MKLGFMKEDKSYTANYCFRYMEKFVKTLGNKKYLNGDKLCIADFIFFEHIEFGQALSDGKTWEKHPTLEAYHSRIANLPGIKEFQASDKFLKDSYYPAGARIKMIKPKPRVFPILPPINSPSPIQLITEEVNEEKPAAFISSEVRGEKAKHGSALSTARESLPPPNEHKIILGYWNIRGANRGNPARYMLSYSGT